MCMKKTVKMIGTTINTICCYRKKKKLPINKWIKDQLNGMSSKAAVHNFQF